MPEAAAPAVVSVPAAQSEPLADPEDVRLRKRWFARVRSELQSEKGKAVEEEDYLRAHDLKLRLLSLSEEEATAEWQSQDLRADFERAELIRLQDELNEPEFECVVCLCESKVSEMFTVDCQENHRFCFDCIRRGTEPVLRTERKQPTCPSCSYELTPMEIKQLFPEDKALQDMLLEIRLQNTIASSDEYVACPTPGCRQVVLRPQAQEAVQPGCSTASRSRQRVNVSCPTCRVSFCSECRHPYHYDLTCGEVAPTSER